jgi:hypothetical protein
VNGNHVPLEARADPKRHDGNSLTGRQREHGADLLRRFREHDDIGQVRLVVGHVPAVELENAFAGADPGLVGNEVEEPVAQIAHQQRCGHRPPSPLRDTALPACVRSSE